MPRKKTTKVPPSPPVSTENTENEGGFTIDEEIAWCIKKLQHLLATKYKDSRDIKAVKPIVIALKTLENKNNPLPKMRKMMRAGCGDYRKEMKEEFEKSGKESKKVCVDEEEVKGIKVSVKAKEAPKIEPLEDNDSGNNSFAFNFPSSEQE